MKPVLDVEFAARLADFVEHEVVDIDEPAITSIGERFLSKLVGSPNRPVEIPTRRARLDRGCVNEVSFGSYGKGQVNGGSILTQARLN